ncbi:alpha-amylase family glycosyl hydrolase [Carboxylicivirga sp. N1Y90]|uniref:alpha-amylase family glycosyl hydrolase n=1 Tax=Carboxylicivirga fragile TaxID=3417571 RepID=UPI003D32E94F|nr:hypothetical protein [Marinilabiliaceae bacterium N1Y90]
MKPSSQVLLQGFYWDVPVDAENKSGHWYDHLSEKVDYLNEIGITGIWCPPPSKGNWGIYDMGYGIYDHYDLGEINQNGTVSTRFGTRDQLNGLINTAHKNDIEVYADVVLNHMYSFQNKDLEPNPVLKSYFNTRTKAQSGYPVNEVKYLVDVQANQTIKIHISNPSNYDTKSFYRLKIDKQASMENATKKFHPITNNNSPFGYWEGRVDEELIITYKVYQEEFEEIWLQLEVLNEDMQWGDQTSGLCISEITDYNGNSLDWSVCTYTGIKPLSNQISWNYKSFHPSTFNAYLQNYPDTGGIVENSKLFGHDFDHDNEQVQKQLIEWGNWLMNDVGYDGARLDFVNGIKPGFINQWGHEVISDSTFCVAEFFTNSKEQIIEWNKAINKGLSTQIKSFDFPLKKLLTEMANGKGADFDMTRLVGASLGADLPIDNVVSFVENHDTGKEHDKWITKDWHMAYSYILFAEPTPCVFYSHLFPTTQYDYHTKTDSVKCDDTLPELIERALKVRNVLNGKEVVMSSLCDANTYVSHRKGEHNYNGGFLVINNNENNTQSIIDLSDCGFNIEEVDFIDALHPDRKLKAVNQLLYTNNLPRNASIWMTVSDYKKIFK